MKRRGKVSQPEMEAELLPSLWLCNVLVCAAHSTVIIKHSFPLLRSHHFLRCQKNNFSASRLTSRLKRGGSRQENIFKYLQTAKATLDLGIEKLDAAASPPRVGSLVSTIIHVHPRRSSDSSWSRKRARADCRRICWPCGGGRARGVLGKYPPFAKSVLSLAC